MSFPWRSAAQKRPEDAYLYNVSLSTSKAKVALDEPLTLKLAFGLKGRLRDSFDQAQWEGAYDAHDISLRVTYHAELKRASILMISSRVAGPFKMVKRATLYWSRNPELPHRVWVMIMLEDGNPVLPKNVAEARSLLFDGEKVFEVLGSDLQRGRQRLYAVVRASWGKHVYTEPGSVEAISNRVSVECV